MTVHAPKRLFTVEEFHRMAEAGVFGEDDRLELIAGEVVEMTPIGSRHAACVARLSHRLHKSVGDTVIVRVQDPIVLDQYGEPQPDISVVRYRSDFYGNAHPSPVDVLLVIEVADASIAVDRGTKLPLYARAAIAEVWIVDLTTSAVEVYRQPSADGYRERQRLVSGDRLVSSSLPGFAIPVAELVN